MPRNRPFWRGCSQTVLPDMSTLNRTKIGGKCQNLKIHMRHFEEFSNNVIPMKNGGQQN